MQAKKTLAIEVITDEMPLSDVCQDGTKVLKTLTANHVTWMILYVW